MTTDNTTITAEHAGWLVAFLMATWGIILRALIGRHFRASARLEERLIAIETELAHLRGRIEGVDSVYKGPRRRRMDAGTTWPGDSE